MSFFAEVHVSAPWPDHLITDLNGMGGKDEFDSDDEEDKTQVIFLYEMST